MKIASAMLTAASFLFFAACGTPTAEEVIGSVEQEQVSHCTGTACSDFQLECQDSTGGDVVCLYARNQLEPTAAQEKQCEHWQYMVEWTCVERDLPSEQPCFNFEAQLIKKCVYVATTMCIANLDDISALLQGETDTCVGPCNEVLDDLAAGLQPLCN